MNKLLKLENIGNEEIGYLISLEENKNIPFDIKRVYYTHNVPINVKRGGHAHKNLEQILICLSGGVKVRCFDGRKEIIYELNKPDEGLYIKNLVWRDMYDYKNNTVLMVLASDYYDENDYIRNYNDFLEYIKCSKYKHNKFFVHNTAIVDTINIGDKTRVWGFSHIFKNCIIGKNCNICEHVLIENDVIIGDNVTIKSGVYIWDGIRISDNVFIGPSVSFINDKNPRSKVYPEKFDKTIIDEGASLGANSTIMCGLRIGKYSMVGAGSVVLRDVYDYEIVAGNPAKFKGYNCECSKRLNFKNNKCVCECGITYIMKNKRVYKDVDGENYD